MMLHRQMGGGLFLEFGIFGMILVDSILDLVAEKYSSQGPFDVRVSIFVNIGKYSIAVLEKNSVSELKMIYSTLAVICLLN